MAKTEKHVDDKLEKLRKEITQEKIDMKTPSTKETIIITVLVTLVIVGALVYQALYFYNLGAETQKADNARIHAEVAKQVEQLKPSQQ